MELEAFFLQEIEEEEEKDDKSRRKEGGIGGTERKKEREERSRKKEEEEGKKKHDELFWKGDITRCVLLFIFFQNDKTLACERRRIPGIERF